MNFDKMQGLVPAVIQDAGTGAVCMVGFMNREALERTMREKEVTFWSRSKARLWKKGETSGNILEVVDIYTDCDNDSLLITVKPNGPVCHTGEKTCFRAQETFNGEVLNDLASVIGHRKKEMRENSYTASLLNAGVSRIAQKVGEEALELAIAAQYDDQTRCIEETADLLYHVLVLLEAKDITLQQVYGELKKRRKQ